MNFRAPALFPFPLASALILLLLAAPAARAEMKAGVGAVVITPRQDMWLSGYAGRSKPSEGKVHDLYAKALLIEDEGGARNVIVTTDILGLPRQVSLRAVAEIQKRIDIPRERIILTSSHTHCGPVIRENLKIAYDLNEKHQKLVDEYADDLPSRIAEAVANAAANLTPARLSHGAGRAEFAVNRRQYTQKGIILGVNPIGPVDRDVPVLKVVDDRGALKAVLFGYACHNTTLDFQKFCGDYAGFAQAYLEAKLPGTTALFFSGCGGDANPDPRRSLELAERHGIELGEAVLAALKGGMSELRGSIQAAYTEIPIELSEPPDRAELEKRAGSQNVHTARLARQLLKKLDEGGEIQTEYPYPIQLLRFGDALRIFALGGEVVVDYALLLKHEFGRERTWVIGYANDVMAYIPSLRILREGGYEADFSMVYYGFYGPWAPTVEERIMSAARAMGGAD
jgi:neutral ceramidase